MNIGDIIKSYDFAPKTDSYMIGRVTGFSGDYIHFDCLKIVVCKDVIDHTQFNTAMRVPVMGCLMIDESFERIVVLG